MLRHIDEKHNGEEVQFDMKIISSYQHDALARQCGEAIWIKETNPKQRINNKEEYHQPGDVELAYTKNDKNYKGNQKKVTIQENKVEKENLEMSSEKENQQRKITQFFIKSVRKEVENQKVNENVNIDTNDIETFSTQEFITDARERRNLKIRGTYE
jgi:hypothetical protein